MGRNDHDRECRTFDNERLFQRKKKRSLLRADIDFDLATINNEECGHNENPVLEALNERSSDKPKSSTFVRAYGSIK